VRSALATLPWVEQDSLSFDFKQQTVTFRFKRQEDYDAAAVATALEKIGNFKGANELWKK
jgi:hypothetical protein